MIGYWELSNGIISSWEGRGVAVSWRKYKRAAWNIWQALFFIFMKMEGRITRNGAAAYDRYGNSYAARYEMPHVELGRRGIIHLFWKSRMAGAEAMEKASEDEWKCPILYHKIRSRNGVTKKRFTRAGGKRMWRLTMLPHHAQKFLRKWTEEPEESESEFTNGSQASDEWNYRMWSTKQKRPF